MSSLLGSIFGGGDDQPKETKRKDEASLSGLFQNSSSLPDRPHHVVKPRKRKEQKEVVPGEDATDTPNKKRKKRKPKASETTNEENKDENQEHGEGEKEEEPVKEETEQDRTVFVGNLALSTTRKELAALFKDCGTVASTRIRSVPVQGVKLPPNRAGDQNLMRKVCSNTRLIDDTLKNTVQGYVVFKNIEDIALALEKNNTVFQGHRIRVDKSSPTVEPSRSVFCGNLPYGADETSLQKHFVKGCDLEVGDVEGVRIIRDKETFQCKGFGYVLFKEKSMVATALKLHESIYMKKPLRVLVCGKRFKGKRGENIKPAFLASKSQENATVGAFRRMLGKQSREATNWNKRKRGDKKKQNPAKKAATPGVSKRAALDKKVDKRVKKLQKRMSKGMGKTRR